MKFNRTTAAATALIGIIALVIGFFVIAGGDDSAAGDPIVPADPTTEQALTVSARDTSQQALSGVAVRLLDATGATVTSGTTGSTGEASLSFTPKAGTYVVVADEPTGYRARDDKDGGATQVGGPPCDNVYLCIYLTVTEVQHADGTTSLTVEIEYVTPDQHGDLDDLWFEMTPPNAAGDEETSLVVDEPSDETTADETTADETADDETTDDTGDDTDSATDEVAAGPPGLRQVCVDVRHAEVAEQNAASGIWVRGEVYGLDGGWIWVEGPTINGGEPVQVPVEDGAFETPLGINSYGEHELTRFDLQGADSSDPIDLLPTLDEGPGVVFPVDSDEGPVFDDECFDFDSQVDADDTADAADEQADAADERANAEAEVEDFLIGFVDDHTTGNVDDLLATLHPSVPLAFGESVCSEYVARTAGSITGAETLSVGVPGPLDLDTPNGAITFPEAIPFTVEFTLTDGSTVTNDANLALHDGSAHWLTRCGVD
ncbi:MAG: hypothetical protein R8G01_12575 [Ilumatobacteraceae bacterium]|nr:hypothetical protein [Ilumatobacteraceae bacterium]